MQSPALSGIFLFYIFNFNHQKKGAKRKLLFIKQDRYGTSKICERHKNDRAEPRSSLQLLVEFRKPVNLCQRRAAFENERIGSADQNLRLRIGFRFLSVQHFRNGTGINPDYRSRAAQNNQNQQFRQFANWCHLLDSIAAGYALPIENKVDFAC